GPAKRFPLCASCSVLFRIKKFPASPRLPKILLLDTFGHTWTRLDTIKKIPFFPIPRFWATPASRNHQGLRVRSVTLFTFCSPMFTFVHLKKNLPGISLPAHPNNEPPSN